MKTMSFRLAVAACFGLAVTPVFAASLIANGSFEMAASGSSLPTGSGEALPTSSTAIDGWTVIGGHGGDGLAWLPSGAYGVTTPFGSYLLDLTGYHDTAPYFGVSQSITTVKGQSYALTFDLGVDQDPTTPYGGPITVSASAGPASGSYSVDPSGTGNIWTPFTLDFTADSTTTTVSLQGLVGNEYIGLDNVAVNAVSGVISAVPLPGSLPLFGGALVGLAFVGGTVGRRKAA